jgi:ATP-grasp domain
METTTTVISASPLNLPFPVRISSRPGMYWFGVRAEDAWSIAYDVPLAGIVSFNWCSNLGNLDGIDCFSNEKEDQERIVARCNDIKKLVERWLHGIPPDAELFSYMNIPELFLRSPYGPLPLLVNLLGNKAVQRSLFTSAGLSLPKYVQILEESCLDQLKELSESAGSLVLAPASGSSGKDVRQVSAEEVKGLDTRTLYGWIAAEFIPGQSINTTVVIHDEGYNFCWPSIQVLGDPLLNACSPFGYCGNDFSATHDFYIDDLNSLKKELVILSDALHRFGYRGVVGADWIFGGDGKWWIIEINPRFQGSTLFLCTSERRKYHSTTVSSMFSASPAHSSEFDRPVHGYQLLLNAPKLGKIVSSGDKEKTSPKSHLDWYTVGMPIPGTTVRPGSCLTKFFCFEEHKITDGNQISQKFSNPIRTLTEQLGISFES